MNLLEKINFLIERNNLNKRQLSLKSGIPYSTIDGFYKVGYENMRISTLKILCDFFNVTMDSMAFDELEIKYRNDNFDTDHLSKEEIEIIRKYNQIDDRGKENVLGTLDREYDRQCSNDKKEDRMYSA